MLLLSLVGLFVWLGFWQLDRAEEKEQQGQSRAERVDQPAWKISGEELNPSAMEYRQVEVEGEYLADHQFLLDNRKHQGKAGYHLLVPMKIVDSERAVLVNRGWIFQGERRTQLPEIDIPQGVQKIQGVVRMPREQGFRLEQQADAPLRLYIDLPQIGQQAGVELLPFVVRQQGAGNEGLIREWRSERPAQGPDAHYGYALQWFSFALLGVGGWIALVLQQRRSGALSKPEWGELQGGRSQD